MVPAFPRDLRPKTCDLVHHVEYDVPSLPILSEPLCTPIMPSVSFCSSDMIASAGSVSQVLVLPVMSCGISLIYFADFRSSSDCGGFFLSSVYWKII